MLILTTVAANNKIVPHPEGGTNNHTFSLNYLAIVLVSGQVRDNVFLSIAQMAVHALEFGDDSAS